MDRPWVWLLVVCALLFGFGLLEVGRDGVVTGVGFLTAGAGAALYSGGERRAEKGSGGGRFKVTGAACMAVGLVAAIAGELQQLLS